MEGLDYVHTQVRILASLPVSCETVVGNDATISSPDGL